MVITVPDNVNTIENIDSVNENLGECETVVKHYWWKTFTYIANHYPVYWNNYYFWDENNRPNVVVYRHGVNFVIDKGDFPKLLLEGINLSIQYTNHFLGGLL